MNRVSLQVLVIAAAVAIGAGLGAAVASFGHTEYRAEASVRVSAKRDVAALMPTVRELATSSVLAGDVRSTLRLHESAESLRKQIHATTPSRTQLVTVSFTNRSRARAEQVAQEIAVKLTQLVPARFGTTIPGLTATLFDQAHVVSRSGPDYLGDTLIGVAIALVLGLGGMAATMRRAPRAAPSTEAEELLAAREANLRDRIAAVTAREQALMRRAGELAERERALAAVEAAQPTAIPAERAPPPAASEPEPAPERKPLSERESESVQPLSEEGPSGRTLGDLERLVAANSERFPDAIEEWNAYLFFLRDYADASGRLPPTFEPLIDEVFGGLDRG